jgi:hypothetical protein
MYVQVCMYTHTNKLLVLGVGGRACRITRKTLLITFFSFTRFRFFVYQGACQLPVACPIPGATGWMIILCSVPEPCLSLSLLYCPGVLWRWAVKGGEKLFHRGMFNWLSSCAVHCSAAKAKSTYTWVNYSVFHCPVHDFLELPWPWQASTSRDASSKLGRKESSDSFLQAERKIGRLSIV